MSSPSRRSSRSIPTLDQAGWALLMTVADYAWRVDEQGVLRDIRTRSPDGDDFDPRDVIGRPLANLAVDSERERFRARIQARLAKPRRFQGLKLSVRRRDGSARSLEIGGAPIRDSDGIFRGYCGGARDLTRLQAAVGELNYRDRVRKAQVRAMRRMMASRRPDVAVLPNIERLGQALGADRVRIVVNAHDASDRRRIEKIWASLRLRHTPSFRLLDDPALQTDEAASWQDDMRGGRAVALERCSGAQWAADMLDAADAQSMMLAPILVDQAWWGTIQFEAHRRPSSWTAFDKDVVNGVAELVGAILSSARHELARRRVEGELDVQIRLDPLTRLLNRNQFGEAVAAAMRAAAQGADGFAVHYIDLDHFKDVNETLGHPAGDRLLQMVGERLRLAVRHSDVVARFGGDEFAILERDVTSPADAGALAATVLQILKTPFAVEGRQLHVGASIGVAPYDPAARDPEAMLSYAELALYQAKSDGRQTYRIFTAALDAEARRRVELGQELRRALAQREFFLVYQPQVRSRDGRITGLEALVRWRSPSRGVVSPSEFIPQSEAGGLMVELGDWILREACRQTREWLEAGIAPPTVSVNISAVQFRRPEELEAALRELLAASGLPPGRIQLELTETTLMEAAKAQSDLLKRLHDQGVKISLDDFGTGYSSLDYLRRYPVDQIKIAQVFVAGLLEGNGDAAIVRAAIGLARELGLRVLAEGVETAEQAELLARWGCGEVQGYYFSRPVTPEELRPTLEEGVVHAARERRLAGGGDRGPSASAVAGELRP